MAESRRRRRPALHRGSGRARDRLRTGGIAVALASPAKRLLLGLLWVAFFVAYLDRTSIAFAGPAMMRSLAMSPQTFGLVLAAFTAGYALMQIPGGLLAERFGAKRILVMALLVWSAFTGLTGAAATVALLIVVRFCFGLGEGLESGAHFKALGDAFSSRERSTASGIFHTALALGPALVSPVAAATIAAFGWRAVFLFFCAPGLIVALAVWRYFPAASSAGPAPAPADAWREVVSRRSAWAACAAYLAFNVAFWGLLNWMPTYLATERHIALKALGTAASLPYLCGFAGLLALGAAGRGRLAHHRPAIVAGSYLCAALGLLLAFSAGTAARSLAGLSLAAFFLYGGFGPFWAFVLDLVPSGARGACGGFVNLGGQLGGFFSPLAVGAILAKTKSFTGCFVFMIAALVCAAAVLIVLETSPVLATIAKPRAE